MCSNLQHTEASDRLTMRLSTQPGEKVKFSNPTAGYDADQKLCQKHLTEGGIYTVESVSVGGWSSDVILKEVPDVRFNTVNFTNV